MPSGVRSSRRRCLAFGLVTGACVLVASLAVGRAAMRAELPTAERSGDVTPAETRLVRAKFRGGPRVVFRSLDRANPDRFGTVAFAPLRRVAGARTRSKLACDRVYFAAGRGLCVAAARGIGSPAFVAKIFDAGFAPTHSVRLPGIPSRARVSPDGRLGATTSFVSGHSYADRGSFSTLTSIIDMASGRVLTDLERFRVTRRGKRISAPDFNFWGVTFARDGDRFYATLATGGKTYLVEGRVSTRRARVVHENVECPSLSPDNTRIAYKKAVGENPAVWRLFVLDLRTLAETPLAESRPIDDQVEWLNGGRILYRVDEEIWVVRADGGGAPRRFLAAADSPAVVSS
jgi:hypothetical protein